MRLLNVKTLKLHTFYGLSIPPYAIISHTWLKKDDDEVTFAQIQMPDQCRGMLGFRKIQFLCEQAKNDDLEFAWIDTCCIDKKNSSELSEAINSMFQWYSNASTCYVYLSDIDRDTGDDFLTSRWWTRAWTLQELIASWNLHFYDKKWQYIGKKADLSIDINAKTGIDMGTLVEPRTMFYKSVAQRMAWAAEREATRIEDIAYSLLGIFGIHMPMQYGEGRNAFIRLQREISKSTNDPSLFAWGFTAQTLQEAVPKSQDSAEVGLPNGHAVRNRLYGPFPVSTYGIFADKPKRFKGCRTLVFHHQHAPDSQMVNPSSAGRMQLPLVHLTSMNLSVPGLDLPSSGFSYCIALIPCGLLDKPHHMIGMLLQKWRVGNRFLRVSPSFLAFTFLFHSGDAANARIEQICIDAPSRILRYLLLQHDQQYSSLRWSLAVKTSMISKDGKDLQIGIIPACQFMDATPETWVWDQSKSVFELQDLFPSINSRFIITLFSVKTSEMICIALQLSSDSTFQPRVKIFSPASDEGLRKIQFSDIFNEPRHKSDNISYHKGIMATIRIRQIFNHFISTLCLTDDPDEQLKQHFARTRSLL